MSRAIVLRGETFKVSPLTFGQLRALKPDLVAVSSINDLPTDDQLESVCRLVAAGLKKDHGYMDLEKVAELVDLGNFKEVIDALMGVSGLEVRPTMPVME